MTFALDTLAFSRHLISAGVPADQADAHAQAVREFVMIELVTKTDLSEAMERQTMRLTIRLGGLMIAGIGALVLLIQLGGAT